MEPAMMMVAATSDAEGSATRVKAELPAHVTTAAVAAVKTEAPVAEGKDAGAPGVVDNSNAKNASVKQLKLRLFQQLARRRKHKQAWSQYWRALQQFLLARLSVDEFHCIVHILLGPDLVELHNAFIVAILNEAQANSAASSGDNDYKATVLRGDEDGSDLKTRVVKEEEDLSPTTEMTPVKKEADSNGGDSSHVKADDRHDQKKKKKKNDSSSSSEEKKRPFSTHISSPDDERAVKKLLHFANSKRDTPEKKQHSDDQRSAELLIGLGNFGSRAASSKSSSLTSQ